jgi:hypothetical protein
VLEIGLFFGETDQESHCIRQNSVINKGRIRNFKCQRGICMLSMTQESLENLKSLGWLQELQAAC